MTIITNDSDERMMVYIASLIAMGIDNSKIHESLISRGISEEKAFFLYIAGKLLSKDRAKEEG